VLEIRESRRHVRRACSSIELKTYGCGDGVAVDADMGSTLAADRNTAIDGVEIVLAIKNFGLQG
jgi:hypothetical protein